MGGASAFCALSTTSAAHARPMVVDASLSGVRVVRELEQLIRTRDTPKIISDNGTELTSVGVPRWVPGRVGPTPFSIPFVT